MTKEGLALLKNIPSLRNVPDNMLIAIIAIACVFVVLFFFLLIFAVVDFIRVEKKEHKAPDSARLILDLQKTLIQEMRGTARQNTIMIFLTIIFIIITVLGTAVSVFGLRHFVETTIKLFITGISTVKNLKM